MDSHMLWQFYGNYAKQILLSAHYKLEEQEETENGGVDWKKSAALAVVVVAAVAAAAAEAGAVGAQLQSTSSEKNIKYCQHFLQQYLNRTIVWNNSQNAI